MLGLGNSLALRSRRRLRRALLEAAELLRRRLKEGFPDEQDRNISRSLGWISCPRI
jgi:hypothetical protein